MPVFSGDILQDVPHASGIAAASAPDAILVRLERVAASKNAGYEKHQNALTAHRPNDN
jgi:hypothetical protein